MQPSEENSEEVHKMVHPAERTGLGVEQVGDLTPADFRKLQAEDPTLDQIREKVVQDPADTKERVFLYMREGVMHREWSPRGGSQYKVLHQLPVPRKCCATALHLAHNIPLAGHMGEAKTKT